MLGDLTIDYAERKVTLAGRAVHLTGHAPNCVPTPGKHALHRGGNRLRSQAASTGRFC